MVIENRVNIISEKEKRTMNAVDALCGGQHLIPYTFYLLNDEQGFEEKLNDIVFTLGPSIKNFEDASMVFECTVAYFPEHYKEIAIAFIEAAFCSKASAQFSPEFVLGIALGVFKSVITIRHSHREIKSNKYKMIVPFIIAGFLNGRWGSDSVIPPSYENVLSKTVKRFIETCAQTNEGKVMLSMIFGGYLFDKYKGLTQKTNLGALIYDQLVNKIQNNDKLNLKTRADVITGTYEE